MMFISHACHSASVFVAQPWREFFRTTHLQKTCTLKVAADGYYLTSDFAELSGFVVWVTEIFT